MATACIIVVGTPPGDTKLVPLPFVESLKGRENVS